MASALQCPACGFKHRLSSLAGDPIFACTQCGRLLKTPAEFRRPQPAGIDGPPHPQPAAAAPPAAAPPAAAGADGARRPPVAHAAPPIATLPLRILAWVVAIALGALIVRYLAKWTGWITGDTLIDVMTGSGWGRYLRVLALAPVWALVSAGLATAFIDGIRWWSRRGRASRPPRAPRPPASTGPTPGPPQSPTAHIKVPVAPQRARRIPRRDVTS